MKIVQTDSPLEVGKLIKHGADAVVIQNDNSVKFNELLGATQEWCHIIAKSQDICFVILDKLGEDCSPMPDFFSFPCLYSKLSAQKNIELLG